VTALARRQLRRIKLLPFDDARRTRLQAITLCTECEKPLDGAAAEAGDFIHDGVCWQTFKARIARQP
jgi:hypothetical protein